MFLYAVHLFPMFSYAASLFPCVKTFSRKTPSSKYIYVPRGGKGGAKYHRFSGEKQESTITQDDENNYLNETFESLILTVHHRQNILEALYLMVTLFSGITMNIDITIDIVLTLYIHIIKWKAYFRIKWSSTVWRTISRTGIVRQNSIQKSMNWWQKLMMLITIILIVMIMIWQQKVLLQIYVGRNIQICKN